MWNPISILGLTAALVGFALAGVVFAANPSRPTNRWLALLLLLEAIVQAACAGGIGNVLDNPDDVFGVAAVNTTAFIAIPFLYLVFLGTALDTPLVRPFRLRSVRVGLFAALAIVEAYWLSHPETFYAGVGRPWYAAWAPIPAEGTIWVGRAYAAVALLALVATLDALRRARTPAARRQAKLFTLAFATRDVFWIVLTLYVVPFTRPGLDRAWGLFWTQGMPGFMIAFVLILGYGILHAQLFDIDLKLKWTLRRGTVVGVFLAVFFIVFAIAEQWLQQYGVVAGGAAVGILVFALRPIERAADRLADATMPRVQPTPEYVAFRRLEVYKGAVEDAVRDGTITATERSVLDGLRRRLGVADADARAIERDAGIAA